MTSRTQRTTALLLAALLAAAAGAADDTSAEFTLRLDERRAAGAGPLAAANALGADLAPVPERAVRASAELRHALRAPGGLALHGNVWLAHERPSGERGHDASRVNELHAALDLGAWQLSAGKRVLGWDVGYAFRPNDLVQQEDRRVQFGQTPEGRALVQVEHFAVDSAWTLVWANPQRWNDPVDRRRGADESAFAARGYARDGAVDLHLFARLGRHSGPSAGTAFAWVATDALELHGSLRVLARHDGWRFDAPAGLLATTNPWRQGTVGGGAAQWLLGAQWTSAQRVSLLAESWFDGTAPDDATWAAWHERNRALAAATAGGAPLLPVAANLAWQATPLASTNLRQRNLFLRAAWQDERWQLALDALWMPADRGRVVTASAQWQGERLRVNASWRVFGGPATALASQLALRHNLVVAASVLF